LNVMRTVVVSSVLALALSASAQSVARLHLSKSINQNSIELDQVEKVLSDITGVSSIRSGKPQIQSESFGAHLVVVANGISSDAFSSMQKVNVLSSEELKNSQMVWKMLRNYEGVEENEVPASVADLFHQANPGSLHVSLSGNSDFLDAISVHNNLISSSNAASVLVKPSGVSVKNSQVSSSLKSVATSEDVEKINREIFNNKLDASLPSDKAFLSECAAVKGLLNNIKQDQKLNELVQDEVPDYFSVSISSLQTLLSKYGADSEKYTLASSAAEKLIEELKASLESTYNSAVSTSIISFEGETTSEPLIRGRRGVGKRSADITAPCFESEDACNNATSSCNSKGQCMLIKASGDKQCFKCKCSSQYAGDSCEFEDKVSVFHTIFWTSLALAIIVLLVALNLSYTDSGTDTVLFRTGSQRPKTD